MPLARIRKGDTVQVLAGKDKGKRGIVRQVIPADGKAVVEGVNVVKRHFKATNSQQAGIVEVERPLQLCNLAPVDPKGGKPTRIRTKVLADGKKVRIAVASGEQIGKE